MATSINFPDNPTIDETYTYSGTTYIWNGTTWNVVGGGYTPALSGTTAQRITATATPQGASFWDTDLEIPCYLESTIWYNAAGGVIS